MPLRASLFVRIAPFLAYNRIKEMLLSSLLAERFRTPDCVSITHFSLIFLALAIGISFPDCNELHLVIIKKGRLVKLVLNMSLF